MTVIVGGVEVSHSEVVWYGLVGMDPFVCLSGNVGDRMGISS